MTTETLEMEHRRLKFTIAHIGTILGRNKTKLLLEMWVEILNNDSAPESVVMDEMHKENQDAAIHSGTDDRSE